MTHLPALGMCYASGLEMERITEGMDAMTHRDEAPPDPFPLPLCDHDLVEREVAVADGYCPICLASAREPLLAEIATLKNSVALWTEDCRLMLKRAEAAALDEQETKCSSK